MLTMWRYKMHCGQHFNYGQLIVRLLRYSFIWNRRDITAALKQIRSGPGGRYKEAAGEVSVQSGRHECDQGALRTRAGEWHLQRLAHIDGGTECRPAYCCVKYSLAAMKCDARNEWVCLKKAGNCCVQLDGVFFRSVSNTYVGMPRKNRKDWWIVWIVPLSCLNSPYSLDLQEHSPSLSRRHSRDGKCSFHKTHNDK